MSTTSAAARAATLDRLRTERFDLLVIGGGITGAGVARDAALRGLSVAVVERDDWASGTSSRSSRLIHGGVRYLEHGHLHLVFEASRERAILLATAPHLVRPLPFTWPVYRGARVPRWKLGAGLLLYDALSLFRNVARHERLSAADVLAAEPGLAPDGLLGGARYYDASTDDTRLTLATAIAAEEAGAACANHVSVRALLRSGSAAVGALVVDELTGDELAVRARVVVNAAGPWGDELRQLENAAAAAGVLGSKGAHIAVPRARVGNVGAVTLLSPVDGRVMFALPAGTHAIIGTTETPTRSSPDEVRADAGDVDYLLRTANGFFPGARLTSGDVVSAWAGTRPLAAAAVGAAGGAGSASREHAIVTGSAGVITVSGGKLTTYRAMAAAVVDAAERAMGRARPTPATTDAAPLPGGDFADYLQEIGAAHEAMVLDGGLPDEPGDGPAVAVSAALDAARRLVSAYGTRWSLVWALARRDPALRRPIVAGLPYLRAELVFGVEREWAATLADLLVRRTHVAFETPDAGRAAARVAAGIVAPLLGWDAEATARQLAAYDRDAARLFAIDPAPADDGARATGT